MSRIPVRLCLSVMLVAAACSGNEDASNSTGGISSDLSTFSAYCTGTLITERELMRSWEAGRWRGSGDLKAPAGTRFLLAEDFGRWEGFVILDDGSAAKIYSDFDARLVKGEDFISDCAPEAQAVSTHFVLLQTSTFYPDQELTGEACVVPSGTRFNGYSFSNVAEVASFSAGDLEPLCGFVDAYTTDIAYGKLVPL